MLLLCLGLVIVGDYRPLMAVAPVLRGRPINPLVAIIPAGAVSLLWPGSSLILLRHTILRELRGDSAVWQLIFAPLNLWLLWGFTLGAATLAYWLR